MAAKSKRATKGSHQSSRKLRPAETNEEKKSQAKPTSVSDGRGKVSQAIDAVRRGEREKFTDIFEFLHERLTQFVARLQGRRRSGAQSGSDTVSETLADLFKNISREQKNPVHNRKQLEGLAKRIAQRRSIDQRRRATAKSRGGGAKATLPVEAVTGREPNPLDMAVALEMARQVEQLVGKEKQEHDPFTHQVLEQTILNGRSTDEFLDELSFQEGISSGALQARIQRAKREMLKALKEKFPDE